MFSTGEHCKGILLFLKYKQIDVKIILFITNLFLIDYKLRFVTIPTSYVLIDGDEHNDT